MKRQNNTKIHCKWREPLAIEFILPVIVTAKTTNICKKYRYRALRKARYIIQLYMQVLTTYMYAEQKN